MGFDVLVFANSEDGDVRGNDGLTRILRLSYLSSDIKAAGDTTLYWGSNTSLRNSCHCSNDFACDLQLVSPWLVERLAKADDIVHPADTF
jgi:hypothetical protein